ncbi:MAG: tryptophan 2,3-dioxygenase [Myxococcales bacterium]|nr:tryptophan 2,3-dioxygenase [Myxococcales bacterium]
MSTNDNGRFAEALQTALDGAVFNSTLRKNVGEGALDYEVYLKTGELLSLQTKLSALSAPDELLFQIVHQTQELWMKQLGFDAVVLVRAMDEGNLMGALAMLHRMFVTVRSLADQVRILQTMPPDVFQVVRRQLGNGSGLESPGYNRFHVAADAIRAAFLRWCERRNTKLVDIYLESEKNAETHRLAEALVDLDESFQVWMVVHYMLVRRTIGVAKSVKALDGFPTVLLASRMTRPLFPELWDVRVEMTEAWKREGGYSPGAEREGEGAAPPVHACAHAAALGSQGPYGGSHSGLRPAVREGEGEGPASTRSGTR